MRYHAMQFARDMDNDLADRFVAMRVNDLTLDYTIGREAVQRMLAEGPSANNTEPSHRRIRD